MSPSSKSGKYPSEGRGASHRPFFFLQYDGNQMKFGVKHPVDQNDWRIIHVLHLLLATPRC